MHSFWVGDAVSHSLAGTTVEALMAYVGWKTRKVAKRYIHGGGNGRISIRRRRLPFEGFVFCGFLAWLSLDLSGFGFPWF